MGKRKLLPPAEALAWSFKGHSCYVRPIGWRELRLRNGVKVVRIAETDSVRILDGGSCEIGILEQGGRRKLRWLAVRYAEGQLWHDTQTVDGCQLVWDKDHWVWTTRDIFSLRDD